MLLLHDAHSAAFSRAIALRCSTWGNDKVWLIPKQAGGLWPQHSVRRNLLQTIQMKASSIAKLQKRWGAQKSSSDMHGCPWVSFLFSNLKGPNSALLMTKMLHSLPHFHGPAQDCSSKSIFSSVAVCTVISGCCFPETHKGRTKHARRWETPELL